MRKPLLLALVLLLPALPSRGQETSIRRLDGTTITSDEAETLARTVLTKHHVTGGQIAVLNGGKLVWSRAFGQRDREHDLPMRPSTTLWAASITKGVFGAYVMQLVERGELSLDEPVARLLPQPLDHYERYRVTASEIVHDPRWPSITPRMLLNHTSGLANFATLEPDEKMHLHFTPGSRFAYSGEGLNLLQLVVEERKHRPLDELMQEAIFTPLKMDRTSMIWEERFIEDVADRYGEDEKLLGHTRRDHARGAGSMTSSAEDLARFASALMAGRVIKPASLKELLAPGIRIDELKQFPTLDEAKGTEGPAVGLAYGLGWGLLTRTRFGPAFFKEGHGDGAQNFMICFTRRRDCMIILTNSDNGEKAFRELLEGILGDTVTPWRWEGYAP
ncbi:MAG TPA: serine hydrolase domain-containing protein [Edaphobacter sp.]